MNRKLSLVLLVLLAAALACRSSNGALPAATKPYAPTPASLPVVDSTPTIGEQTPSAAAQPDGSFTAPDQTSPQQFKDITSRTKDIRRDVTYCTLDGVDLKMDVYIPKNVSGQTPLTVFIHGGGWSKGDKADGQGILEIPALLDAGFTVASLNYRLAPEYQFPAMIEDVKCAIRSLRAHADEYDIDPDRIGVWGNSAGAHLSTLIGLTDSEAGFERGEYLDQSSRVQVVVDMFGPANLTKDFSKAFVELKEPVFADFDLSKASPVTYITPDDPPFLILQGDADHVVPLSQSQELYDALIAGGVEAQMIVVSNGNHGFKTPNIAPSREEITAKIVQFFQEHLK